MKFYCRGEDKATFTTTFETQIHAKLSLQAQPSSRESASLQNIQNQSIQIIVHHPKNYYLHLKRQSTPIQTRWQISISRFITKLYLLIILLFVRMSQGFKNLMKPFLFNDDSFQPLLKKNQQYRKSTQISIDHFQTIVKNFQTFEAAYSKIINDYDQQTEQKEINIPQYYHQYIQLYRNIYSEQKYFCEKLTNNFKELTSLCNNIFINYSNLMLTFQGLIRSYKSHEQILFELSKKYFRSHKNMLANIESYKSSFTDVKLIYNMDEKNKRFNACEGTFKNLTEQLEIIDDKLKSINEEKQQIINSYVQIEKQFKTTLKTIGSKLIAMSKLFMHDYCIMQKTMITYLAEKKFTLEKIELKTSFSQQTKIKEDEYFSVEVDKSKCQTLPCFLVYSKYIKEDTYQSLGKLITAYVKEAESKIQQRMILNKKALEFTSNFLRAYEKSNYLTLKEITSNFQKNKKKISQIFGNRLSSFLKSTHSVFDISIGINQKLIKRTPPKLKQIESSLSQQAKTLDIFLKQLRSNVDKFLKKKEVKKIMDGDNESNQFTEEEPSNVDLTNFKNQLGKLFQYLAHLIEGFVEKTKKIQDQIKFQYNSFVNDFSISTNEIYSLCCQYQELYFGQVDFVNNYKKYQLDIDKTLQNQSKFFQQINFGVLLKEEFAKITFQSQISKVQEYKKIKKPMQIQIQEQTKIQEDKDKDVIKRKDCNDEQIIQPERKNSDDKSKSKQLLAIPQKQVKQIKDKQNKYEQFLISKIAFLPEEKFYNSYSCGLSDKIILTGRLYITNKRLCFHSKFNPNNVFFGQTFIQIPRKDIKKIEKRYNAIVFDNSISVTTVHGQVFLTSFFSRNEAYDLICSALDINAQEVMFEPQEIKQEVVAEVQPMLQEDDIKEEELAQRQETIERSLNNYQYKELCNVQFTFSGLNALKFLKIFQLTQDFTYNRKNYKSWTQYFKATLEHKECELGQWSPSISQYLNSSNIKTNTPLSFKKKISCIVPIPNSGVPFMPKTAKSQEQIVLHLYSKDKYIIESTIQNSGVPYSDTFNLKFKKIFQSKTQDKCSMRISMYINFVTSTMMKSMIQSKTLQQTKTSYKKYEEEINKYLKYLDKKKKLARTQSKVEGNQQYSKQNEYNNEENEKQINQLRQSEQKLKNEVKINKVKLQQNNKMLLASVIVNVILMLIILM